MTSFAPAGLQDDVDADVSDADSEVIAGASDAETETEPLAEVDPLAELRAQVGTAATKAELESLRNQIRSELGRSQRLETRLEELSGRNPLADVDPRLDANENLLTSIAEALIDSDLTDDTAKRALRASRAALDSARTVRSQGRMREELKAEILGALPPLQPTAPDPWAQATQDVLADIAENLPGFDIQTIPATVWNEGRAKGTPARAAAHVLRWAERQAAEPATTRIATRRAAAGTGAPARQGATGAAINTMDEADEAWNAGRITFDQYKAERERFLVGLAPGGGR